MLAAREERLHAEAGNARVSRRCIRHAVITRATD
jgi:hypothetical protein